VIQQTSGDTSSAYHTGTPGWEWLEVTKVIATDTAFFDIQLFCDATPNVDGTSIVYISQDMLVFGWSLGEGMYQPRQGEIIWLEAYITSNILQAENWSVTAFTDLNLEADADAMIPKGCKAVFIYSRMRESGSAATLATIFECRKNAVSDTHWIISVGGIANNAYARGSGWQSCDENGDFDYSTNPSGAGTMDISTFRYLGIQVN
jgi:hypothetical protein